MSTIVYMKDGSFLPSIIELVEGDTVSFSNEDAVTYELQCRNNPSIPETRIRSKKIINMKFPKNGRYEITEAVDRTMQCIVEVKVHDAENTPKSNVRYFPLSTDRKDQQSSSNTTQLRSKPPPLLGSSNLPMHKRMSIPTLKGPWLDTSPMLASNKNNFESNSDDEEEFDNMKSLRRLYKQGSSSTVSRQRQCLAPLVDVNNSAHRVFTEIEGKFDSTSDEYVYDDGALNGIGVPSTIIDDLENMSEMIHSNAEAPLKIRDGSSCGGVFTVFIKDFDFEIPGLDVEVGDSIEFKLSPTVPLHAEHELVGHSALKGLRFVSPMLQVDEIRSYVFCPVCEGEVDVRCRIYQDMHCIIRVHPQGSLINLLDDSHAESIATADAVVGISHQMMSDCGSANNTARAFDEDSFYDSDDMISEEEREAFGSGVRASDWIRDKTEEEFFEKEGELLIQGQLALHGKVHSVYIDRYDFRPANLICKRGENVRFVLDVDTESDAQDNYDSMNDKRRMDFCLECEGLFDDVFLSKKRTSFIFQFNAVGVFEIKNKIFQFSTCVVSVSLDSSASPSKKSATPSLFGSFAKTRESPSRPIFHLPLNSTVDPNLMERSVPCHKLNLVAAESSTEAYNTVNEPDVATSSAVESENESDNPSNLALPKKKSKTAKKRQNQRKRARESKNQDQDLNQEVNRTDSYVILDQPKVHEVIAEDEEDPSSCILLSVVPPDTHSLTPCSAPVNTDRGMHSPLISSPEKLSYVQASCDGFIEFSDDAGLESIELDDGETERALQDKQVLILTADVSPAAHSNVILHPKVFDDIEFVSSGDSENEKMLDQDSTEAGFVESLQNVSTKISEIANVPPFFSKQTLLKSPLNVKTKMLRSFLRINGDDHTIAGTLCDGLTDMEKVLVPGTSSEEDSSIVSDQSGNNHYNSDCFVDQEEIFFCSFFEHRLAVLKQAAARGLHDTLPNGRSVPIVVWTSGEAVKQSSNVKRKNRNRNRSNKESITGTEHSSDVIKSGRKNSSKKE